MLAVFLLLDIFCFCIYNIYFDRQQLVVKEVKRAPAHLLSQQIGPENTTLSRVPKDFIQAAALARAGVVFIQSQINSSASDQKTSNGSGILVSSDGYVLTNNHVLLENGLISVTLNDNRSYEALVVGTDPATDLALLQIEANDLPYLKFGNSDSLQVGEWVLAAGSPFKLQSSVTAGIVSAKGREIDILDADYGIESFIQTDAAINRGNSGGALVNTDGLVVGISTAIISQSGNYEGFSFAIPSNLAYKVLHDIKQFGTVHRGLMGIKASNVDAALAKAYELDEVHGVLLNLVYAQSGAADAGLQAGDVIQRINNKKINNMADVQEIIGQFRPGQLIEVAYFRKGKSHQVQVVLKNKLNTTDIINVRKDQVLQNIGIEIRDLLQTELKKTQVPGAKVISIYNGSKISKTQMEPGYIITRFNDKQITNAQDFIDALQTSDGKVFLEGYYEYHEGPWWYAFEYSN